MRQDCVIVGRESVTRFLWQGACLAEEWQGENAIRWHDEADPFQSVARELGLVGAGSRAYRFYLLSCCHTSSRNAEKGVRQQWQIAHGGQSRCSGAWQRLRGEGQRLPTMRQVCPLRFQSKYEDDKTGLFYSLQRNYDSLAGMNLSPDPIGLLCAGARGRSAMCISQPNGWVNPWGELHRVEALFPSIFVSRHKYERERPARINQIGEST